ncbi:glycine N-methyltransferase isoform X1 [Sturnira hondurensis]|uniref:glycine N-methyltransferase isoform X1 n=1 Tax=Sturnira hondurensis TaxID=192404 RepID=UPI00187A0748|nr:glycine N-methyltransferase isoform X1 [Sturnira hondurensis]
MERRRACGSSTSETPAAAQPSTSPGCSGCCTSTAAGECSTWPVALGPLTASLRLSSAALPRVDSIMLVEEGFSVTSVDASDKMLKYALKERWNRRHEPAFDKWVIEEANWMTLDKDVPQPPEGGFDAVICLGNSFAHLPDCKGDQSEHRLALKNIANMVCSGGLLVIDHRNYDHILSTGFAPPGKNIYYKSDLTKDITTSVLTVNNKAHMVTLDYTVQVPGAGEDGSPGLSISVAVSSGSPTILTVYRPSRSCSKQPLGASASTASWGTSSLTNQARPTFPAISSTCSRR